MKIYNEKLITSVKVQLEAIKFASSNNIKLDGIHNPIAEIYDHISYLMYREYDTTEAEALKSKFDKLMSNLYGVEINTYTGVYLAYATPKSK